jgi:hypothetical protein
VTVPSAGSELNFRKDAALGVSSTPKRERRSGMAPVARIWRGRGPLIVRFLPDRKAPFRT